MASVERDNHEEYQYLDALYRASMNGVLKPNRTANKTMSYFGNMMKFSLHRSTGSDSYQRILPLMTTKNMKKSSEIIFKELEFFIKGQTDGKILKEKEVKIWDANGSREFLDLVGLKHREVDDLGPIYGYQWRHFGAEYKDCHTDYTGQGIDQLQNVIDTIKKDPYNRKLIVSAWNPLQLKEMALAPCHLLFQFNVSPDNSNKSDKPVYLDCMVYQRSADLPLGVPFNIASYAALTHIVSYLTDLIPREFVYVTADTHVYEDQLHLIPSQIFRKPYPFPELEFDFGTDKPMKSIDDFKAEYLKVKNYKYWPSLLYPFST